MTGQSMTSNLRSSWCVVLAALAASCTQTEYADLRPADIQAIQATAPATAPGQTATLLSDGRWLLAGGAKRELLFVDAKTGASTPAAQLQTGRAGHTATVLPDGTVLILGGAGSDGGLVAGAEIFDPATKAVRPYQVPAGAARIGAAATLLQDGRLLISGGSGASGAIVWNLATGQAVTIAGLEHERQDHLATLLPSGAVLIRGGQSADGSDVTFAELFDPPANRFLRFDDLARRALPAEPLAERKPEAAGVALADTGSKTNSLPSILFNKPIDVKTISTQSVTLVGRSGEAQITLTAAERGLLLFVHPRTPLAPGADYTVFLKGLADEQGHALPFTSLHFVTPSVGTAEAVVADSNLPLPARGAALAAAAITRQQLGSQPADVGSLRWETAAPSGDDELWIPNQRNIQDRWWSTLPKVDSAVAPSAQAGVTALSGRVLRMNGLPLAGVTLTAQGRTVATDGNGFFLLQRLQAGAMRLDIDGRPASRQDTKYGNYAARVTVAAGVTTPLPYTIWMPKLDPQGTVRIPSPTTEETVVSTPSIPGLELHIPAGAIIRGRDGKVLTELNITAIPTNQPPFPLPDLGVPTYFTIQPGGATIEGFTPESRGARLFYPNFRKEVPYARGTFWNYDADDRGWFIYGSGTVTPDATQSVPDPGVVITEFTGAMFDGSGTPPYPAGPVNCDPFAAPDDGSGNPGAGAPGSPSCGDPVDVLNGQFTYRETDLFLPDVMPIRVRRTYRSFDLNVRMFGVGTTLDYDVFFHSENQYTETDLVLPTGKKVHYVRTSPGTSWTDAVFTTQAPGRWYGSVVSWNGNGWDLRFKDGALWKFVDNAPVTSMTDRHGNQLFFTRGFGATGPITRIDSPNGRWVTFTFDATNQKVIAAKDSAGRTVTYTYDASNQLTAVTNPNSETRRFNWTVNHLIYQVVSAKGDVIVTNSYGCKRVLSVVRQVYADGSSLSRDDDPFACLPTDVVGTASPGGGNTGATVALGGFPQTSAPQLYISEVTDRAGQIRHVEFDDKFRMTKDVYPKGTVDEKTTAFTYDAATTLLASITDPLGRTTKYVYDVNGNVAGVTHFADTPSAITATYTYDTVGDVLSITDPLSRISTFVYDGSGDLLEAHDPAGNTEKMTYDPQGRLMSATNALNHTAKYYYSGPDLRHYIDTSGNTTQIFNDSAGRVRSIVDALGQASIFTYDAAGRLIRKADAAGNILVFGYDLNGNMTSNSDQRGNSTGYGYDVLDRRISRTDPLGAAEGISYTPSGQVDVFTARNGQRTTLSYDTAGRVSLVRFGSTSHSPTNYESSIAYVYDGGDRVVSIVDSSAGQIDYQYTFLNMVHQETNPLGYVEYDYDSIGRRTQMRASQQPAVSYAYDSLDNLVELDYASDAVHIAYDELGRYSSLGLRNGVSQTYNYDSADRLASIVYVSPAGPLGNMVYKYDALGRIVSVGGSLGHVDLPQAISGWTYNANNQVASLGYVYDANGRLTSDGVSTFVWNARDQLVRIDGASPAQFAYDGEGRRTRKNINSVGTQFLYDGPNYIQELADGASPASTATYLTGLNVDEVFGRTKGASKSDYMTERLGSTVAITDSSGNVSTSYSYEAFGRSSQTGNADANATQFTGGENDVNGLIYLRSRYYDPKMGRFISEDELGLGGGLANLYSYVGGDPLQFTDPSGQAPIVVRCPHCKIFPGAVGGAAGTLPMLPPAADPVTGAAEVAVYAGAAAAGAVAGWWMAKYPPPPPMPPGFAPPAPAPTVCTTQQQPDPPTPDPKKSDGCAKACEKAFRWSVALALACTYLCMNLTGAGGM
jgi:RHS repeat-associated protein